MGKCMSLVVCATLLGVAPALAATDYEMRTVYTVDTSGAPVAYYPGAYNVYQARPGTQSYYSNGTGGYYPQPILRSTSYRQNTINRPGMQTSQIQQKTRRETVRRETRRKYFLAHPFFQPVQRKFGSITDFSYNTASYSLKFNPDPNIISNMSDTSAKWKMNQFSIKEDFSYGIAERVAILGMLDFDFTKMKWDWSTAGNNTTKDNGLNLFGLGLQWRFADTPEWIATLSGYYQRQKDISNNIVLDLKAGYKIASTTIYGLLHAWYLNFDGNSYGNVVQGLDTGGDLTKLFVTYNTDAKNTFYIEGGLGIFAVLSEDWTLNLEATFGDYDWHDQLGLKAAIGWQPNDWFALDLYGKTSLYDSASDKTLDFWFQNSMVPDWTKGGNVKLDDYSEMSVGLRAIFMF